MPEPRQEHRRRTWRPAPVPLSAWRRLPPASLRRHEAELRRTLDRVAVLGEPRWRLALDGDGAAAAALGIEAIRGPGLGRPRADLVMGAVALRGLAGDPTAALVVAHGLARLARRRRASARLLDLSRAWIAWNGGRDGRSRTSEGA